MKKLAIISALLLAGCLPPSDKYPHKPAEQILAEAQQLSDSLEAYITHWTNGKAPDAIPERLIPKGITDSKHFYLKNPDQVTPEETWAVRYAKPINRDSVLNGLPDPNVTYLFLGTALAPFGSKLVMEGEFPHARFFSVQITPPLNGKEYYAQRTFGTAEVSVVDADITPLPGHVNPYRVGADRRARNRKYRLEFDLVKGDPVDLNAGAHVYPFRGSSRRKGAMLVYQGPLGSKDLLQNPIPGGGEWNLGGLWVRIYAPDPGKGPLGGVAMPKVWFELPDGRKYFIGSDFTVLKQRADATTSARITTTSSNPRLGPEVGWFKSFGVTTSILNGISLANGWSRDSAKHIREIDLGWTGRGEAQPAPGNYETHATVNNYASYISRTVTVENGMVAVLTGKLPSFPDTRRLIRRMPSAQLRYWSIGGYDNDPLSPLPGAAINMLMDDQVQLDADRNYTIVYSKAPDRPYNANQTNGVTWVDWGPTNELGLMMRWVAIGPEWTFDKAPHEVNLPWAKTDWSATQYDSTLIGVNGYSGFMGCYLPRLTLMTKAEFEELGTQVNAHQIPVWVDDSYRTGPSIARSKSTAASSVYDNNPIYQAAYAIDGNLKTKWASKWGQNPAFLQVDLRTPQRISAVKIMWDFLQHAVSYTIQTSDDASSWKTVYTASSGDGGTDLAQNLNVTARYVRLQAMQSVIGWYGINEFEVYSPDMPCQGPGTVVVANQLKKKANGESLAISVFPNPTRDEVRVVEAIGAFHWQLKDSNAKLMKEGTSDHTISLQGLPPGLYYLIVQQGKTSYTRRIVKR